MHCTLLKSTTELRITTHQTIFITYFNPLSAEDGNEDDDKREEELEDNTDADTCALTYGCYSYPSDCSASTCTFSLRWNQTEAGLIEVGKILHLYCFVVF